MSRGYTAEYVQWLEENNYSPEDEKLILKTATGRMVIWLILSCIPSLGIFVMPLLMNAWTWRKIIKQKSFEPRPGLLYSLFALAMYITFILIIPWILWVIVKKGCWGCGIRGLIRKGKIGNGPRVVAAESDSVSPAAPQQTFVSEKKHFPWWIIVALILVVLVAIILIGYLTEPKEPNRATEIVLQDYCGSHVDDVTAQLDDLGIRYEITYVTEAGYAPGTVIRQTPVPGALLDAFAYVDLVVASDRVLVPDFSTATSVEEILSLAKPHLQVELIYTNAEAGMTYDHIPEGMAIDYIECNYFAGAELPRNSEITVTIYLKYQYDLVGHWYNAECTYDSLYLAEYYFGEDGTFSYYYMGYMAVDYETDLYTYGTYWDGAMGDESYTGTYLLYGNLLILSYDYWDWVTETTEHTETMYYVSMENGSLILNHIAAGFTTQYLPGKQPEPDAVLPFRMDGSWYALGTPEDGSALPVHTFYFWANGEFENNSYLYLRNDDDWYFPGAGFTYAGNYTFDGTQLVLHYTRELVSVHDDEGNYIGMESIAMEKTYTLILTVTVDNGRVTNVACDALDLSCMVQIDPSPYVNIEIMGAPMEHANQLFP